MLVLGAAPKLARSCRNLQTERKFHVIASCSKELQPTLANPGIKEFHRLTVCCFQKWGCVHHTQKNASL